MTHSVIYSLDCPTCGGLLEVDSIRLYNCNSVSLNTDGSYNLQDGIFDDAVEGYICTVCSERFDDLIELPVHEQVHVNVSYAVWEKPCK